MVAVDIDEHSYVFRPLNSVNGSVKGIYLSKECYHKSSTCTYIIIW